ncbi:hypothetical protein [Desulfitobacterium hafniense]|uniref:hypothetical protein n=1 Tax=Desulfitobacterium hafniense TaxID=49338 RepID=UPI00059E25C6|nr:hypothetical protein [Desulfitobacterium hafniense]
MDKAKQVAVTDEQILSILKLSDLPEVRSVEVRQATGQRIGIGIHTVVDADISPVIAAFESIVPGVEIQAEEPYEMTRHDGRRELIQVYGFDCYPTLSVGIFEKKGMGEASA